MDMPQFLQRDPTAESSVVAQYAHGNAQEVVDLETALWQSQGTRDFFLSQSTFIELPERFDFLEKFPIQQGDWRFPQEHTRINQQNEQMASKGMVITASGAFAPS